ncbi:MAG: LysR family transcriptional regulator [Acetobacteraceae bacterium]|nr:LysR family transcriptional regulator [Acetobacteraceae bacterium]
MRLRNIDLNLLVVFEALQAQRSVSNAAEQLGLTQSAVSHALRRLRATFGDELFIHGKAGLEPTPRAAEAADTIRIALEQIERAVGQAAPFDPATATRSFSLRISEYVSSHLLQHLCPFLQREAPGIQLRATHFTGAPRDNEIVGDEIHVSFGTQTRNHTHYNRLRVVSENFVVVMRRSNPAAATPLTLAGYIALNHVKVSGTIGTNMIDDALARLGLQRHVVFQVPTWRDACHIAGESNLVAAMPARWAMESGALGSAAEGAGSASGRYHIEPLPLDGIVFAIDLLWQPRYDADAGHAWLRAAIAEQFRTTAPPTR